MAVTENAFTGNGSTTNYSFTFPYLKSSDIEVQVDATVTTAWSLANATTVQFNTAPANGAKIKILRQTNVDNLTATFYAGSAIKSEDLNDNYTQNLYVTQEIGNRSFQDTGGAITGDISLGEDVTVAFEGATDNAYETTVTVVDPTADRTITLPNVTGTVVTTGDTGTVTSAMITDGTIGTADLANGAVNAAKIANDTITATQIAANAVTASELADDAVDTDAIVNLNVTTAKIAADAIVNSKLADDAVQTENIANGHVNAAKLATDAVTTVKITDLNVTTAKIAADAITNAKLADDAVQTENIANGHVNAAKLATDAVETAKIKNLNVTRAKLEADIIDDTKIADSAVQTEHIANGHVTTGKLATDCIDSTKIADNAVGTEHIADAELTTLAGMQSATASILAANTDLTATLAEINTVVDGKSVETTISDTDAAYPTSGAVVDYVAAQIAPIGGLEVIATDAAFPNTQPAAGVVISIADAGGLVVNGSGTSTTGRTVGASTVTINNIASNFNSTTIDAGVAMMVSSTGSGQIYNYHKATLKEADLLSLSNDINDFAARYRVVSGEPGSNNDEGDLIYDTNADKMKVYDSTTSAFKEVTSTGDFKYLFLCPAGGTGAPTINGSIATYDLRESSNSGSAASVTNAAQLVVSVNGVIQKANTGTSAPAEGFAMVDANTIIFGTNLPSGASVFIHQAGSAVSIPVPGDNTVSTAKYQNNSLTEEKLAISNAGSNGQFLSKQSGNTGGLTWASVTSTPEGTAILSTGESGASKFLREDGDGTSSWQTVVGAVADNCIYENSQTISNNYTIASGKGAHSVGPITVNATVTVNGNWVVS